MMQTLFYIPHQLAGISVFGWGWALALWLLICICTLVASYRKYGWGPETRGHLPVMAIFALMVIFVLPRLEEDPEGGLGVAIRGFGVLLLIAVVAAVGLSVRRARQFGFDVELVYGLAFWCFLCGILGARTFFVIQKWEYFRAKGVGEVFASLIDVTQGGIVVYGSLLGAVVAFIVFVRRHRLPPLAMADLVAPSLVLGLGIGRIGCLMNGCCYGGLCDEPWALRFPSTAPPFVEQQRMGLLHGFRLVAGPNGDVVVADVDLNSAAAEAGLRSGQVVRRINGYSLDEIAAKEHISLLSAAGNVMQSSSTDVEIETDDPLHLAWTVGALPDKSLPVHPTQIYSAMNALVLCIFLLAYSPFRRRDGELLAWLFVLYPISRFLLEIIRADEAAVWGTSWTISQNLSIVVLILGLGIWVYLWRRPIGSVWTENPANPAAAA